MLYRSPKYFFYYDKAFVPPMSQEDKKAKPHGWIKRNPSREEASRRVQKY